MFYDVFFIFIRKFGGTVKRNRHSLMRSGNDNSMDWLESCKQSLNVKSEKEVEAPKTNFTSTVDNSNDIDCKNKIEKENCEISSKNLKTDIKEKIYTINDIIDDKHLIDNENNKGIKNTAPLQNNSILTGSNITNVTPITKSEKPADIGFNKIEEPSHRKTDNKELAVKQREQPKTKSSKSNNTTNMTDEKLEKAQTTGKRKRVTDNNKDNNEEESDTKKMKVSKKAAASKGKRFLFFGFSFFVFFLLLF